MSKLRATITGVGGYVPEYRLTNDELSQMVDTTDEWIMTRIGIKERRILKEKGKGASDMQFPATANVISDKAGIRNAFSFDLNAGCSWGSIYVKWGYEGKNHQQN